MLRQELSIAILASVQTGGKVKPTRFMPSYTTADRPRPRRKSPAELLATAVAINRALGGKDMRVKQA